MKFNWFKNWKSSPIESEEILNHEARKFQKHQAIHTTATILAEEKALLGVL